MRVVVAAALITHAIVKLQAGITIIPIFAIVVGLLLFAGLWTPVAGTLVVICVIFCEVIQPGDPWRNILLGTLSAALAMIGPGVWSVDAKLFGWKRIEVSGHKS